MSHPTSFFILDNKELGTFWIGQMKMKLGIYGQSLLPTISRDQLVDKLVTKYEEYSYPCLEVERVKKDGTYLFYGLEQWLTKLDCEIKRNPRKLRDVNELLTAGWIEGDPTINSTVHVLHINNTKEVVQNVYRKLLKEWETKDMRCLNRLRCKTDKEKYEEKKKDPNFMYNKSRKEVLRQMKKTGKMPKPETLEKYQIKDDETKEVMGSTGIVYKLTCPEGKSYIGRTIQSFQKRMNGHVYGKGYCRALKEAINKHGFDSFEKEIIWEGGKDVLPEKEAYFIQHFNTMYPNGYNLSTGGGRGEHRSTNTIQHMIKNQRELAKQRNNGLLGYIVDNKSSWTVSSNKCWIGNFKTKEEALSCQRDYTHDPDRYHDMYSKQRSANGDGGIYYRKDRNKWIAMPHINGKNVYIGSYTNKEEACEALAKAFL